MTESQDDPGLRALAEESAKGLKGRLLSGYGAQGLGLGARILEQIILVPFFITAWGIDIYRDWVVLFAGAGFLALFDLGLQTTICNSLIRSVSRGEVHGFQRSLVIGLGMSICVTFFALCLLALSTFFINWPQTLGIQTLSGDEALWVLVFLALAVAGMVPRGILNVIYVAKGDYDRATFLTTCLLIVNLTGVICALTLGASPLQTAFVLMTLTLGFGWLAILVDQRRRYSGIRYTPALPNRAELRELVPRAFLYFIPLSGQTLLVQGPILILSLLAAMPGAVVIFTISRTLTGLVRQIAQQFGLVSGVELARQLAQEDTQGRRRLFLNAGRLIGGIGGFFGGLLLVMAESIIRIWTKGQVAYDPVLVTVLYATVFLSAPAQVAFGGLHFANQPRPLTWAFLVHAGGGLLLAMALAPSMGALGVVLALGAAEFISKGVYLPLVAGRSVGVDYGTYIGSAYGVGLVAFVLSYVLSLMLEYFIPAQTLTGLLVYLALWSLAVSLPVFYLLLSKDQRAWVIGHIRDFIRGN